MAYVLGFRSIGVWITGDYAGMLLEDCMRILRNFLSQVKLGIFGTKCLDFWRLELKV